MEFTVGEFQVKDTFCAVGEGNLDNMAAIGFNALGMYLLVAGINLDAGLLQSLECSLKGNTDHVLSNLENAVIESVFTRKRRLFCAC